MAKTSGSAPTNAPKILFFDVEIAKNLYAKFPPRGPEYDNYTNIIKDWWIICFAYKWSTEDDVTVVSVLDYPELFQEDPSDDSNVVAALHALISEADVIIGHRMEAFDWKKFYARVLYHDLPPLNKPKIIDTHKMAKAVAEFSSGSLDYLTKYLKLSEKKENRGNDMWNDLIKAMFAHNLEWMEDVIDEIVDYCVYDVPACEDLYYKLLPHASNVFRVNMNLYSDGEHVCPCCSSKKLQKRGFRTTITGKFQAYQCKDCGAWSQDKTSLVKVGKK